MTRIKYVPLRMLLTAFLLTVFVQNSPGQQVITFSSGSFQGSSMQVTATGGLLFSGSMENASMYVSGGIIPAGQWVPTSAGETDQLFPAVFRLDQNYPNPFNPATTISYDLPETATVRLEIYDSIGRRVAVLVDREQSAGTHTVTFDASHLSSGVYLYRLAADGATVNTRRMTLVK